jgi:hypothetical protein
MNNPINDDTGSTPGTAVAAAELAALPAGPIVNAHNG